ncbi:Cation/H+ exchanger [Macleaya cordata]|uniref:Cation/H+ exchanger n=1 Tax=Macleaya cordata TaxID=56857 RepID=A0A200QIS1_MACCD|nr:Cation/H+ exchanger [Macleaya cordata]
MILGPSILGKLATYFGWNLFPVGSLVLLESTGILGLMYYFFVLGLTMDLNVIKSTWKKGILLAFADLAVTTLIAIITYSVLRPKEVLLGNKYKIQNFTRPRAILGVAASMMGFPVLNRILVQLRLSNTEIGRIATSCSIVETTFALLLLPIIRALTPLKQNKLDILNNDITGVKFDPAKLEHHMQMSPFWVYLSIAGFIIVCFVVVRPVIQFVVRQTPDGESFSDFFVTCILAGVTFCGFLADLYCPHLVFGPFLLGLVISRGPLGTTLIAKIEDIAYGIMLPLYFAVIGLRTHLGAIIWKLRGSSSSHRLPTLQDAISRWDNSWIAS